MFHEHLDMHLVNSQVCEVNSLKVVPYLRKGMGSALKLAVEALELTVPNFFVSSKSTFLLMGTTAGQPGD